MKKLKKAKLNNGRSGHNKRWNWPALKTQWIQLNIESGLSLFAFRKQIGVVNTGQFYREAEKGKWNEERDAILKKAMEKNGGIIAEKTATDWKLQEDVWSAVEKQAMHFLAQNVDPIKRTIKTPIDPQQLSALTISIERALKCRRLMAGKSTDIFESKDYHIALVKLVEDFRRGNPDVIDSTNYIPGLDSANTKPTP